jgi:predicted nuclease of restriction endonuclease-like RecB superfamily
MLTKEQLEQDYQKHGLSMNEIAKKYKISGASVFRAMKKYGLQSRPPSQAMLGKKCTPERAANISAANKGKVKSKEHRKKLSEAMSGIKHWAFGKPCRHSKRIWHQQSDGTWVSMRSNWEIAYARYLDEHNINYKYEPKTFILSNGRAYTPDFLLISSNEWVEIKGWYRPEHKEKLKMFLQDYPQEKLIFADKNYLENLGIDLKQLFISTRPQFCCEYCGKKFYRIYKTQRMCSKLCSNRYITENRKRK